VAASAGQRYIVEVRDFSGETALCPAEAILLAVPDGDVPEGEQGGSVRGDLYPAAQLDEGGYVLRLNGESWRVLLRRSRSQSPPTMVIVSGDDPLVLLRE